MLLHNAAVRVFLSAFFIFTSVCPCHAEDKFTIVAIPDTQSYVNISFMQPQSSNLFINEIQFIVDNINNLNIVFATHEGDVVNSDQYEQEWLYADSAISLLKNTIPFSMVPGNHDLYIYGPYNLYWNEFFGSDSDYFRNKTWYGGACVNSTQSSGMSSYQTFTAGDIDFLHIGLEYDPPNETMAWAQDLINSYPGWPTIITIHKFVNVGGNYLDLSLYDVERNSPQDIWDKFIKVNPQIFLLLCGHAFTGNYNCSWKRINQNDAGFNVYQLLADYQGTYSGSDEYGRGGGWLRFLEVDPLTNIIRVRTYSTILNKYSDDPSLTNGSAFARLGAAFNYDKQGTGTLYPETHAKSSQFTIPFVYGSQLPRPSEKFGSYIVKRTKSFPIGTSIFNGGGIAFDPSFTIDGSYDKLYYISTASNGTQGLYSTNLSQQTYTAALPFGTLYNPYGSTVDSDGNIYVCFANDPSVWKIAAAGGTPTQMLGNYRGYGDDDLQSIMMVPPGFGGGYEAGKDLILIDSGLDNDSTEAVVVLKSTSKASAPQFTVLYQDTSNYFQTDLRGCASSFDGYCYIAPESIQKADYQGLLKPSINRIKPGSAQVVILDTDITRDGSNQLLNNSITVNPIDGSVWLATSRDNAASSFFNPRIIWRIDMADAVNINPYQCVASATMEIVNLYNNFGTNGMTWSPDGRYLTTVCQDTDKLYVYEAALPQPVADAGTDQSFFLQTDDPINVTLDGSGSNGFGYSISYKWTWTIGDQSYESTEIKPTIELPAGLHTIKLTVNNGQTDSETDEVNINIVGRVKYVLNLMPKALNARNKAALYVRLQLPLSISINLDEPLLLEPGARSSIKQWFTYDESTYVLNAFFEPPQLPQSSSDNSIEVYLRGRLTTGQYFYGTDNLKIIYK